MVEYKSEGAYFWPATRTYMTIVEVYFITRLQFVQLATLADFYTCIVSERVIVIRVRIFSDNFNWKSILIFH
jgi:hypothetical protein